MILLFQNSHFYSSCKSPGQSVRGIITFCIVAMLWCAIATSCKKKNNDVVPNVPVDINIYTTDPLFFSLQVAGGWEYITGGSRGIMVYRVTNNDFVAFDRHCTYQPSNSCGQIEAIYTNISAVDSCCGSQFSIVDGSVQKGPAALPLKQYQTTFDGTVLHVFN